MHALHPGYLPTYTRMAHHGWAVHCVQPLLHMDGGGMQQVHGKTAGSQ